MRDTKVLKLLKIKNRKKFVKKIHSKSTEKIRASLRILHKRFRKLQIAFNLAEDCLDWELWDRYERIILLLHKIVCEEKNWEEIIYERGKDLSFGEIQYACENVRKNLNGNIFFFESIQNPSNLSREQLWTLYRILIKIRDEVKNKQEEKGKK